MGGRMVVASVSLGVINSVLCLKYFNLVQKKSPFGDFFLCTVAIDCFGYFFQ